MTASWRLLVTAPLDGPTNMAIDEALLRARVVGAALPTIRFYGWAPPTVSLGYAQPLECGIDWARCASWGIGRVRRPTGGSAILHESSDRELTYSVVARVGDFPGADDLLETYRVIGAGLQAGLARLGVAAEVVPLARPRRGGAVPTFCFARTGAYEIAVGARKLVGSAQRRQRGALLQHGAVLLAADPARLRAVFPEGPDPSAELTTVEAAVGRPVGFDTAVSALADGFAEVLGVPLVSGALSPGETECTRRLIADKYATESWMARAELTTVPVPAGLG